MTPAGMEACVKQVRRPDTMLDECETLNCRSSPLLSVTLEDLRHVKSSLSSAHPYQVALAEQTFHTVYDLEVGIKQVQRR